MKFSLDLAKTHFFDRPVVNAVKNAGRKILGKFGAFVRRDSRSSIKQAKRKSTSQLTPEERSNLNLRFRLWAAGRISKKPEAPYNPSQPGNPPFAHGSKSPLKRILFAWDPTEQSVTVGPIAFGRRPGVAPEALEYGGDSTNSSKKRVSVEARPFMTPAFNRKLPHLQEWRNSL